MTTASEKELLHTAIAVLRRRAGSDGSYAGLSEASVGGLCSTLSGVAEDAPELDGVDRGEAVRLAHRVLDDDHPEDSPLWPG